MNKTSLLGILSAVVYCVTVVLCGLLWRDYSHSAQAISELSADFSPVRTVALIGFGVYNLLLAAFGIIYAKRAKNRWLRIVGIGLSAIALFGVGMLLYGQDEIGATPTAAGILHLTLAGATSLATVIVIFCAARGYMKSEQGRRLAMLSTIIGIVILIVGPLTGMAAGQQWPYFGLYERLTIGLFIGWLLVLSVSEYRNDRR